MLLDFDCVFSNFYHALACLFCTGHFTGENWDNTNPEANHFIPKIVKENSDGTIDTSYTSRLMTTIVKDLMPNSTNKTY